MIDLLAILSIIGISSFTAYIINEGGYKRGQVDAINGKIKYELKSQEDGATEWRKIK